MTAWSAGRLGGVASRGGVLFGRMYEDWAIEQRAFAGARRVFAIASAGCTALALARDHDVVACDINPVQLAYARRRGAEPALVERGAAERFMDFGRWFLPLIGWRRALLEEFLELTNSDTQIRFWEARLETWRFRHACDLLLSPRWLRLVYAAPLLAVLPDAFGAVLRGRLRRGFARHPNASNPWARALLLGEPVAAQGGPVPPIEWVPADAASYLERCEPASFDGFTLSNIYDGAGPAYRARLDRALRRAARPGATVIWRTFAEPAAGDAESRERAAEDRSLLWGAVFRKTLG